MSNKPTKKAKPNPTTTTTTTADSSPTPSSPPDSQSLSHHSNTSLQSPTPTQAAVIDNSQDDIVSLTDISGIASTNPELLPFSPSTPPIQSDFSNPTSPHFLNHNDAFLESLFKPIHKFLANKYTSADFCWHSRLKDEISLGLQCCEYIIKDEEQDIGSEFFELLHFYHSISPSITKDFHTPTNECASLRFSNRRTESLHLNFQQRVILAQCTLQWLSYLYSLTKQKCGPEVQAGLDLLYRQFYHIVASEEYKQTGKIVKWVDYLPNGLETRRYLETEYLKTHSALPISPPPCSKNTNDYVSLSSLMGREIEVEQYQFTPVPRQIDLSIHECLHEFSDDLTNIIHSYEAINKQGCSILLIAWSSMPDQYKKKINITPVPEQTFYQSQYILRKYLERNNTCIHECLRRELLLALIIEDSIQPYVVNDSADVKLSLLWDSLSNKASLCPTKKCIPPTNDPFIQFEHQYLTGVCSLLPQSEKLTIYRQAQHVMYSIVFHQVPQAEMISWFSSGIRTKRQTGDAVITIAAKTAGPYPPALQAALNQQVAVGHQHFFPAFPENDPPLLFAPGLPIPQTSLQYSDNESNNSDMDSDLFDDDVEEAKKGNKKSEKNSNKNDKNGKNQKNNSNTQANASTNTTQRRATPPLAANKRRRPDTSDDDDDNDGSDRDGSQSSSIMTNDSDSDNNDSEFDDINTDIDINTDDENNSAKQNFVDSSKRYTPPQLPPMSNVANKSNSDVNNTSNFALSGYGTEKTSSLGSLVLKNGLLQLPSAMINTKQHIISPNRLDISSQTAIMTYFNGLTAVAGKYREINPFDSIDSSVLYPTRDEMIKNPIRSDSMVLSGEESDSKDEDDEGDDFSGRKGDLEANLGVNVDKIDNLESKNGPKSKDNDSKNDDTKKDPIRDSKSLTNRVIISHFEHQETHLNTINDAVCEIISNQGDLNEQVGLLKRVVIASGEQIELLQNFIENLNILNKKNCEEFNEQKNIVQKQNEIIGLQQKQINALLKLSGLDSMRLDSGDVTGSGSGQDDRDISKESNYEQNRWE
jgi:hypothetical protein